MKKFYYVFCLLCSTLIILVSGCGANGTQNLPSDRSNDKIHDTINEQSVISNEKSTPTVNLPKENITLDDQNQVEQLISTYFKSLEKKDYASAWELTSTELKKQYSKSEAMESHWGMDSVKLISVKGYLPPTHTSDFTWDVPANMPIVTFAVTLDVKPSPHSAWNKGENLRFVIVVKENDRQWKIRGLATSP